MHFSGLVLLLVLTILVLFCCISRIRRSYDLIQETETTAISFLPSAVNSTAPLIYICITLYQPKSLE